MSERPRRWYTCTPVPCRGKDFVGDESFFMRDSGLFCRSLRQLGIESKSIMALPGSPDDFTDELLRTEYANLESATWWKSLDIDGVILYSWGAPRYRNVARAIDRAGLKLAILMDFSGDFVPWWNPRAFLRQGSRERAGSSLPARVVATCREWLKCIGIDLLRNAHLSHADAVILSNPYCREKFRRHPFYNASIARNALILPCPIHERFRYDEATPKQYRVVAIGRWDDDYQKRPAFLMAAINNLVEQDAGVIVDIYGTITPRMEAWRETLAPGQKDRVLLHGFLPNEQLLHVYRRSMVSLCSSTYEGSHIVSVEALCCGCSVVCPPRSGLLSLQWYATEDAGAAGTVAAKDTPESLADAVRNELRLWKTGRRNPVAISQTWSERTHAVRFLPRLLAAIDPAQPQA